MHEACMTSLIYKSYGYTGDTLCLLSSLSKYTTKQIYKACNVSERPAESNKVTEQHKIKQTLTLNKIATMKKRDMFAQVIDSIREQRCRDFKKFNLFILHSAED